MKKDTNSHIFLTIILSVVTIPAVFSAVQLAHAQQTLDIATVGGNETFGGEKIGSVTIVPNEHIINIIANMSLPTTEGKVFEGWLVDAGGSDFKLSLGEFAKTGALEYTATMVNPYTYTQFVVTEEPFEDPDPNAAAPVAGAELKTPFGQ